MTHDRTEFWTKWSCRVLFATTVFLWLMVVTDAITMYETIIRANAHREAYLNELSNQTRPTRR